MEQLDYNLLYRWFVGLAPDDLVWDPTTFTKNRERLQGGDVFQKFMAKLLNHPQVIPLLSDEHFPVDRTPIEAWAKLAEGSTKRSLVEWPVEGSQKSFRPKDGSDPDGGAGVGNSRGQWTRAENQLAAGTAQPRR